MTTPYLPADLEREEARKLVGYLDSKGIATIGVGHTGPEVHVGMHITPAQADAYLVADLAKVTRGLDGALHWWRGLSDVRQDVLASMAFQMGVGGLLKFKATLSAVEQGLYDLAASRMLASQWATQDSPARARRMAMQMRSGVRAWARLTIPSGPDGHNALVAAAS